MNKSKILVSWLAHTNDFDNGKVNPKGTTMSFHQYFFELNKYDKHIILSGGAKDDIRLETLINELKRKYPSHLVEGKHMSVSDPIDMKIIYSKISKLLIEQKENEIDVFASPGTPAMFASWILAHQSLKLTSKLYQTKRPEHSAGKDKPELVELKLDIENIPYGLNITTSFPASSGSKGMLKTKSLEEVYHLASKIALTESATVLITGETGTGKENLAKYIHDNSSRTKMPYVTVNCSAIGDSLLESRLFGYKKGAFTGADKDTIGLVESANGGTIFLDEIGDISPYMQQSLLRVIQEKEISRVGETKTEKVDVRFICATHKNLWNLCKEGKFRFDLYYRLTVAELFLPPLLKRGKKEIEEYIEFFIRTKKLSNKSYLQIDKKAFDCLIDYAWPGNLREVENTIERLYIYFDKKVSFNDLPQRIREPESLFSLKWDSVEKEHIIKVLEINKGNIEKTGSDIGYSRNTLIHRFEKYKINPKEFK